MNIDVSAFDRLAGVRILVVGDVMLDRYFSGDTSRISPEAPVPVVKVTHVQDKAGGAANVAPMTAEIAMKVAIAAGKILRQGSHRHRQRIAQQARHQSAAHKTRCPCHQHPG
jgi:bifunctional ADP-heptose synthase (sugar kinase/adenylyltransferase)